MKAINLLIFFIIVFIVGIVVMVGGGYIFWKSYLYEGNIEERRRQDAVIKEEAIKFGKNNENKDCIEYVIPKVDKCSLFNKKCEARARKAF